MMTTFARTTSKTTLRIRTVSAVVGAGAVLSLGAFAAVAGHGPDAAPTAKSATMTIGATTSKTTEPNAPATTMAVPALKGPAPLPAEEKAAE